MREASKGALWTMEVEEEVSSDGYTTKRRRYNMPRDSVNEYTIQRVRNAWSNVDGDRGERLASACL